MRLIRERHEREVQHLVRAIPGDDLFRRKAVQSGERFPQRRTVRIVVVVQPADLPVHRGAHARRRRERRFIRVQADESVALLVIARDIGGEMTMLFQQKTAHVCSPISED